MGDPTIRDVAPGTGSAPQELNALPKARVATHGLDNRGLEFAAATGATSGRFARFFSFSGCLLKDDCLRKIADAVIKVDPGKPITEREEIDENPRIPAGYTYFGQFVDHDLTLDTTPLGERGVDVAAITNFRTPALDLDCIYGRGPDDQPYLYESDGRTLRLGEPLGQQADFQTRRDVLRLPTSDFPPPATTGKGPNPAVLGDKRNDENRIVCQLQSAMISFHNKVLNDPDLIADFGGIPGNTQSQFATTVDIVRWHYQWLILHDYLARLLAPGTIETMLKDRPNPPALPLYNQAGAQWAYMPVEFAGAAFRLGHSMVRPSYALNDHVGARPPESGEQQPPHRIPLFSRDAGNDQNLNGFGFPLPNDWGIDWSFFFDIDPRPELPGAGFKLPQMSYRLDANIVHPLADLPEFRDEKDEPEGPGTDGQPGDGQATKPNPVRNLAYRNLVRGTVNLRLPSGEQVANALGITPLPDNVLWSAGSHIIYDDQGGGRFDRQDDRVGELITDKEDLDDFNAANDRRVGVRTAFIENQPDSGLKGSTPLWYYILREAEFYGATEGDGAIYGGEHLGPVGSRLVAETFIGLLWADETSFLRRRPMFEPHSTIMPAERTVGALLKYALPRSPQPSQAAS